MTGAYGTPWPAAFADAYRREGYWRGQSLAQWLDERVAAYGERTALVQGEVRWQYRTLANEAEHLARALTALGIAPGDRVVVQLPNCIAFFVVAFALFRIGALPVFALPAHRRHEIGFFCRHTRAVAYIAARRHDGFDYRELARAVQDEAPTLRHTLFAAPGNTHIALERVPTRTVLPPAPGASAVALLLLSGGSTGTPKLVPRTSDDYLYGVRESARICGLTEHSVYLAALPAAHNYALSSPGSLGVLHAGGTVVLCDNASPDTAFPLIERERVNVVALVPPLVPIWLAAAERQGAALASLALVQVGGARFAPGLAERTAQGFGAQLQQVFGMAEGLVSYTRLDDPPEVVTGTQGRPISPSDEILIVDDEDRPVATGQAGHLLTRGPYTIRGYYDADAHNASAFTADGFYRTGDRVRMTPEGYLIVEGRAKDQINRGGEKISPVEIEQLLLAHAGVVDAAMVPMPDQHLGERSCAYVIRGASMPSAAELIRFVREQGVAHYKVPDRIEFVEALPKTPVGKIDKQALRRHIVERLADLFNERG